MFAMIPTRMGGWVYPPAPARAGGLRTSSPRVHTPGGAAGVFGLFRRPAARRSLPDRLKNTRQIPMHRTRAWMFRPQRLLEDSQGAFEIGAGGGQVALGLGHHPQVVDANGDVGIVGAVGGFVDP